VGSPLKGNQMGNHSVRARRAEIRAYMAEHGVNYTTAARALGHTDEAAAVLSGPPEPRFGGHEFGYERDTDLFRCVFCRQYEVSVQAEDGSFAPCTGPVEYGGDTERVYLLVTESPAWNGPKLPWHVNNIRLGRLPRFSRREGRQLIESAPSVVDELARRLSEITITVGGIEGVRAILSIERLTEQEGKAVIAANYAAYVEEYGEPE
jgi:hypothetical protein